jgi:hypothetical protein
MSLADRRPRPELAPLVASIDQALVLTRDHLQGSAGQAHLPPLRQLYREAIADPDIAAQEPVLAALDELIDAVNTVASGLGLGLP